MNLLFKKSDASEISVFLKTDGVEKKFEYISMIKELLESRKLDIPEIVGDFSDAEKKSIESMMAYINEALKETDSES